MDSDAKFITSTDNPLVKDVVRLQQKKRERDKTSLFVIEGYRENLRALGAGVELKTLIFCRDWFLKGNNEDLITQARQAGVELVGVSKNVFLKISYRDRPDGFISIAKQLDTDLKNLKVQNGSVFLVVEQIEKPGNLGTLLRGCDATGVDGLIVCEPVTDVFNPNVVRASTGALFSVPVAVVGSSQQAIDWLKKSKVRIFSTTPHTENIYWNSNFNTKGPIAVVAGAEQYGLTDVWLEQSDELVKLPMQGSADSLNIAVSSIVCLYEVLRQRG